MTNDIEKIKSNWHTFEKLCKRISDENLNNFLEALGERICIGLVFNRRALSVDCSAKTGT